MTVPQVTTNIANGAPATVDTSIPSRCAVIGAASSGVLTTKLFSRRAEAIAEFTEGPLVRAGVHCIDTAKREVIFQRCEASNPGEYDDIDNTEFAGTAVPAAVVSSVPQNELELYIEIQDGGTVTVDGITYRQSTANGRIDLSGLKRLGTATSFTFGSTGAEIELLPPTSEEAVAVAHLNEQVVDFQAHVLLTAGGVHGVADPAAPYTIGTATDYATGYTVFGQLRTSSLTHVGTIGTTHGAADTAATTAITAIAVPSTPHGLISALAAFKLAFFGDGATVDSGHTQRTASAIHGAQDGTNLVTTTAPVHGTVVAGDIIRCQTFAPYPSTDELAAAFETLAKSDKTPGFVLLPGRTPASYAATISAGLDLMKDPNGKPVRCMVQARRREDTDTTAQEYRDNLESETSNIEDTRILWASTDALCTTSEGSTRVVPAERFTGFAINLAASRIQIPFWETTWQVGKGNLPGVRLVDDDGVVVGWDEPRNIASRLQLLYQVPNAELGRPTVAAPDYTLAGEAEDLKTMQAGFVQDEIVRVLEAYHWSLVGLTQKITITSPGFGVFKDDTLRQSIQRTAAARLRTRPGLQQGVSDIDLADFVTLAKEVQIVQGVIYVEFTVKWTPAYPIGRVTTTISVRTGVSA